MQIYFEVPGHASPELRARLTYAFRLFCAIYGHAPVVDAARAANSDAAIRYRGAARGSSIADARTVWLCPGLRARDPRQPAPPPLKYARHGLATLLHYEPEGGKSPDWLGEIFEWVSCADEYSVSRRDRIGRPLFEATYAGRHGIDTRIPYAALAMRGLQQEICRAVPRARECFTAPAGVQGHAVIPTHDIDYFPVNRTHTVKRLARNALISGVLQRRPRLGLRQAHHALRIALGGEYDPLDRIMAVAEEERQLGFSSSYYFLVRSAHRRDARYSLRDPGVLETMRWLRARGMEIGLHGSFTSLDDPRGLEREAAAMAAESFQPLGGRQHWLRYTHEHLLGAIENAGLQYDTSIGWSTRIGFRAGACFAFPPYDFRREAAAGFLEFPLAVMDQALAQPAGREGHSFHQVAQMLAASRRLGWGGISLLWHPAAFGTGWLPEEVGDIYWRLAADRLRFNDAWMNSSQFLEIARPRFVRAGLLPADAPALAPRRYSMPPAAAQRGAAEAPSVSFAGASRT